MAAIARTHEKAAANSSPKRQRKIVRLRN
jgi:hypothetical protein